MAGNTFGSLFRLTTFGESHGPVIGGVIDGCPPGLFIDKEYIAKEMQKRSPSGAFFSTLRSEPDEVEFISGIQADKTSGAPIAFLIRNVDQRPGDYETMKDVFRPSHADYTWKMKFGTHDQQGGGRTSARETAARVAAGAVAKLLLSKPGIRFQGYVSRIGTVSLDKNYRQTDLEETWNNPARCPDKDIAGKMLDLLREVTDAGDSVGGVVSLVIRNVPPGLGEPVFDKLHADLAKAMLSINAAKGFEIGSGFHAATMRGSVHNDPFAVANGKITTLTNYSGGIQGGISNGEDIFLNVAFKPVPSIRLPQQTVNADKKNVSINLSGRHDACIAPRAVVIVEAMAALVVADHLLRQRTLQTSL